MAWAFLIISIIAYNSIMIKMPKRLSKLEMWTASLFALVLSWTIDGLLDLKLDLYGYFNKGVDYGGIVAVFGIYPAVNIIFLNYFPLNKSVGVKSAYIFGWMIYALIYESLAIKFGMFYYNGWKMWYSAPSYLVLFTMILWHLKQIRKWITYLQSSRFC